jgi:hypothetical protein
MRCTDDGVTNPVGSVVERIALIVPLLPSAVAGNETVAA